METELIVEHIRAGKPFFCSVNENIGVEKSIPRLIENRLNLKLMIDSFKRMKSLVDSIYGIIGESGEYELYYRLKVSE